MIQIIMKTAVPIGRKNKKDRHLSVKRNHNYRLLHGGFISDNIGLRQVFMERTYTRIWIENIYTHRKSFRFISSKYCFCVVCSLYFFITFINDTYLSIFVRVNRLQKCIISIVFLGILLLAPFSSILRVNIRISENAIELNNAISNHESTTKSESISDKNLLNDIFRDIPSIKNTESKYVPDIFFRPKYLQERPYYRVPPRQGGLDVDYIYTLSGGSGEIVVYIKFKDPKITPIKINDTIYYVMTLEGCGLSGKYGEPLLPICTVSVALPTHAKFVGMSASTYEAKFVGKYTPIPKQKPVPIGMVQSKNEFIMDKKVYSLQTLYPESILNSYHIGYIRRLPIIRISLNPIQVVPATGEVYLNTEIKIVVRFNLPSNYKYGTYDQKSKRFIRELLGSGVIGLSEALKYSEAVFAGPLQREYDYVIITHDDYHELAELYKIWKEEKGLSIYIANLSSILNNYTGVDTPEKIRNFIIQAYNNWGIEYVLIIGDADDVPPREVEDPAPYWLAPDIDNGTIPTDMYYACLDGNWNADGDDTWGEVGDNIDWYPELIVGRIPGDSVEEIARAIKRLILYEFAPAAGDWRRKALLLGAQAFDYDDGAQFFNRMIQNYIQYTDYEPIKLYDTEQSPNDNLTTENTINYIMNGAAIVNFWDHGSPDTWWQNVQSTGGDPLLTSYDVYNNILIKEVMYPFVFAMACATVPFDHEYMDNNMGESWFRTESAGAIAYFGSARIAYAGDDGMDGLNERWWFTIKRYWMDNRTQPIGWLIARAKINLTQSYDPDTYGNEISRKTLLETAFLGDPELGMLVADDLTITLENDTISADPGQTFRIVGHVNRTFTGEGVTATVKVWILTRDIETIDSTVVMSYSNGTFVAELSIPSGTSPGKYILAVFAKAGDEIGRIGKIMNVGTLKVSVSCEPFVRLNHNVNITGRVLDKAGTPIGNAEVNITIIDAYGNAVENASVNTNTTGHYIYSWNTTAANEYEIHIVVCDPTGAHWGCLLYTSPSPRDRG